VWQTLARALELVVFSALILVTRGANYQDVFVGGNIYFVDADCYSRMTRARMVAKHPGLIVRQENFENFPDGISPHTTAPLDYLIVGLAALLQPFTLQPLDLAGALVSPLFALFAGWILFFYWRQEPALGRYAGLTIYGLSAILVHGTALGRPDHQALLILLLLLALGAEWRLQEKVTRGWSMVSGLSWGLAFWVSLYEPLVLLGALTLSSVLWARQNFFVRARITGWLIFSGILLLAALIERRWPEWPVSGPHFSSWAATIGELQAVSLTNPIWLQWGSGLLLLAPFLLGPALRRRFLSAPFFLLLCLLFFLTSWEARWGYYFALLFCLTTPGLFSVFRRSGLGALVLAVALLPFLRFWAGQFWPNEKEKGRRVAERIEKVEWRAAASSLGESEQRPVIAPWWLSPETSYWSGQPLVAGSSHESLPGIVDSARFFLSTDAAEARAILHEHNVQIVLAFDSERVLANSAAILGRRRAPGALGEIIDRYPSRAPDFLRLIAQNGSAKIYRVLGTR
jgi:hypothetical protein